MASSLLRAHDENASFLEFPPDALTESLTIGERRRVQRGLAVGHVDGGAALPRLGQEVRPGRLHPVETGHVVDPAQRQQIAQALVHPADDAAVADAHEHGVGGLPPQLLADLEGHRLLPLAHVGVDAGARRAAQLDGFGVQSAAPHDL